MRQILVEGEHGYSANEANTRRAQPLQALKRLMEGQPTYTTKNIDYLAMLEGLQRAISEAPRGPRHDKTSLCLSLWLSHSIGGYTTPHRRTRHCTHQGSSPVDLTLGPVLVR
jgi:hypothetical protein